MFTYHLLLCILSANLHAFQTPASPTYQHIRAEHQAAIKAGTPVVVVNHFGDVRTRPALANTVEMVSHSQFQHAAQPQLVLKNETDQLTIDVVFPATNKGLPSGQKVIKRVDLTLFIPNSSALTVTTEQGLVEVKGHAAPLFVTTDRGEVRFKNSAMTQIKTVQGNIKGTFKGKPDTGKSHIETIHGTVDLRFADQAAYRVQASTKGHITSDYTMKVDWKGRERLKQVELETGKAGAELMVDSQRGNVMLLREI